MDGKADGLSAKGKESGDASDGAAAETPDFIIRPSPGSIAGESPLYDRGTGTPVAAKASAQQTTRFLRSTIRPVSVRKGRSDLEENTKVATLENTVAQMKQAQLQVQSQLSRLESLIVSSFGSSSFSQVDLATSQHFNFLYYC